MNSSWIDMLNFRTKLHQPIVQLNCGLIGWLIGLADNLLKSSGFLIGVTVQNWNFDNNSVEILSFLKAVAIKYSCAS